MDEAQAIATLARYASAYPACLDGIAERLAMDGAPPWRVNAYRTAEREIRQEIERAAQALNL